MRRNPFFVASGFTQQEAIDILEGKEDQIAGVKAKNKRMSDEKRMGKSKRMLKTGARKKVDKKDQIQRGFDIADKWSKQDDIQD